MIDFQYAIKLVDSNGEFEYYRTHPSALKPEGKVSLYNTREAAEKNLDYVLQWGNEGRVLAVEVVKVIISEAVRKTNEHATPGQDITRCTPDTE